MNKLPDLNVIKNSLNLQVNDIRQEPPIPVERIIITEKPMIETQKSVDNILVTFAPVVKKNLEKVKAINTNFDKQLNNLVKNDITTIESVIENKKVSNLMKIKKNFISTKKQDNLINFDAIKKEESELAAYVEAVNMLSVERHEKLKKTEKHKQEIEKQKQKIMQAKQEHKKNDEDKSKILNEKPVIELDKNSTIITNSFKKESLQKKDIDDKILDLVLLNNKDLYKKKDTDMNYTLLDNKLNNEKIKEISFNNSKELHKGPILNALTKRVLQRSISINDSKLNDKTEPDKIMHNNNKDNSSDMIPNSQEKIQNEYFLPIALKMRNQTKVENTLNPIEHKSDKDVQIIHRDILENHEREKREINIEIEETSTKVTSDISNKKSDNLIKNFIIKDNEKCCKRKKKLEKNLTSKLSEKISQNSSKSNTIEISLIKTNVYLSDQRLENTLSIDSNISIREEYIKLKQRDLKFVNTGEDYI